MNQKQIKARADKSIKDLPKDEAERISKGLKDLEYDILCNDGLRQRNGGFVVITLLEVEEDSLNVKLEYGIQCGSDDDYTTTNYKDLDLETFNII